MTTRVAINGFGRIGRLAFRHFMELDKDTVEVVAINDIVPLDNLAYLLRYDSVYNEPTATIEAGDGVLHWNDKEIRFTHEKQPTDLPWGEMDVDIAVEASGVFTKADLAAQHLEAGADYVIVTAPSSGVKLTVCMGVNEEKFDPSEHKVISNASCTTNCLAPVVKVLHDKFGIVTGLLTTVHAYTSSQAIVDAPSKKWRRGRAAAVSVVPTTTGAATATTEVIPELEGRLDGMAMRVPVPSGSIIDFVFQSEKDVSVESINEAFHQAAQGDKMKGILGITEEELVSSDIIGSNYSALVDAESTMVLQNRSAKVLAWYDNEWGYARRVVDLTSYVAERITEKQTA